ncbi:uncharacterized protein TNCV_132711 [Trichonephila clavipes]|nr:uncharacterized protein TNCV_132711 [Trichonephila clavipes]
MMTFRSENFHSRVNEKIAQFCVTVKKRTEVVFPPSPRIVTMVRIKPEEEKGERGHRVTCVISVKKLDDCPSLRLVNLPSFRLEVLFHQTQEHYQPSYQLQCEHYGIDKIALAAKACLFEIFFRLLATW